MNLAHLDHEDPCYPSVSKNYQNDYEPKRIALLGNTEILKHRKLAFFCSVKCPGNLVLQTYDLAQSLRDNRMAVIGGFHSPMEKECLTILLKGSQSIIVCPARNIEKMRLPKEFQEPLTENRLLILSPFGKKHQRNTVETSTIRNEFVAALSDAVFVAYAAPDSKTEQFCKEILTRGKKLFTLENNDNTRLIELGARPIQSTNYSELAEITANEKLA